MKLSARSRYGLKLSYILAENYPVRVSAAALEREIKVSGKYIEKIMRALTKEGLVRAERGTNGGYLLAKPPCEISVGSVVRALEDEMEFVSCIAVGNSCSCPAKSVWQRMYDGINGVLDSITLQNMLDDNAGICTYGSCNSEDQNG